MGSKKLELSTDLPFSPEVVEYVHQILKGRKMPYVTVDVDVDYYEVLDQMNDDDLIDELKRRGVDYNTKYVGGDAMRELLETIWLNRRNGKPFDAELDKLIYGVLGKVI
jgi:hypothetical protein